jgi:hypothetical protein
METQATARPRPQFKYTQAHFLSDVIILCSIGLIAYGVCLINMARTVDNHIITFDGHVNRTCSWPDEQYKAALIFGIIDIIFGTIYSLILLCIHREDLNRLYRTNPDAFKIPLFNTRRELDINEDMYDRLYSPPINLCITHGAFGFSIMVVCIIGFGYLYANYNTHDCNEALYIMGFINLYVIFPFVMILAFINLVILGIAGTIKWLYINTCKGKSITSLIYSCMKGCFYYCINCCINCSTYICYDVIGCVLTPYRRYSHSSAQLEQQQLHNHVILDIPMLQTSTKCESATHMDSAAFNTDCPVCLLTNPEKIQILECKHMICMDCFANIVSSHPQGITCPLCRASSNRA